MSEYTSEGVATVDERRHILCGDLDALEFAIADYVAKWGQHITGQPYQGEYGTNIAGIPYAVANMAMTVIRKNLVTSWTEQVVVDVGAIDRELKAKARLQPKPEEGTDDPDPS